MARRPSSVRPSVRPSANFCANRFYSQTNGRIATKLSQDGLQVSMHPGCAQGQGQGQRSRDTRIFWDSWNELLRHWWSGLVCHHHHHCHYQEIYSVSKKNPPPEILWHFFPNGWEFLVQISHAYYTFLSTLDYKFLFNYLQLWQGYAILSVITIMCSKCPPSTEMHAEWSHLIWHNFVKIE